MVLGGGEMRFRKGSEILRNVVELFSFSKGYSFATDSIAGGGNNPP